MNKPGFLLKTLTSIIAAAVIVILITGILFSLPKDIYAITLRELAKEVEALSDEEEALIEEIIAVETLIEINKNEIKQLTEKISVIEDELNDLTLQRNKLLKSITEKRKELEEKIIYTYKYGKNSVIKMIVAARDINEFVTNLYFLRNLMKKDAELIESIRLDKENYDMIMRKSEEKKKEYEETVNERESEQKKLEANLEKDNILLEKVKGEKATVQKTLADIKERIAKIQPPGITLAGEWKMVATAYFAGGGGLNGDGITATGLRARKGIIAVDPRVIPLGTRIYIDGYGEALAADTGGWIKGDRIDLCFDTLEECYRYGRRRIYVYLIEN
ncbi:MAG: hypothetical protein FJW69_01255 [Actinobacteria bacterium]|nr:hypothetical protein [Actinomycetota bacterium]